MRSHYALTGTIRYYRRVLVSVETQDGTLRVVQSEAPPELFDIGRWAAPPHLMLATTSDFLAFTRRYGLVSARRDSGVFFVSPDDLRRFQGNLREAWKGNENVLAQMSVDLKASLRFKPSGPEIVIDDLWNLIRMMFLQDHFSGRARVCANPECETRFFLAIRKSQRFCSPRCTVLINVRRFREREATLRAKKKSKAAKRGKHAKAKKA
jgi:CGNR zinc finger